MDDDKFQFIAPKVSRFIAKQRFISIYWMITMGIIYSWYVTKLMYFILLLRVCKKKKALFTQRVTIYLLTEFERTKSVISTYQRRLIEMPYVPRTSYGRASLGDEGDANNLLVFFTYLFSDNSLATSFWRTWDCFAARWHVILAVAIWTSALHLNSRTLSGGDVGEGHLLPYALLLRLPGTFHGSSGVTSLSRK